MWKNNLRLANQEMKIQRLITMVVHAAKRRNASSLLGFSPFRFFPLLVDHGKESLPEGFLSMQASSRPTPYRLHSGFREL